MSFCVFTSEEDVSFDSLHEVDLLADVEPPLTMFQMSPHCAFEFFVILLYLYRIYVVMQPAQHHVF